MDKWDVAISFVLGYEGGLVDNPQDPGGLTNMGISQRAYPNLDIRGLTVDSVKEIYKNDYWNACHCDELPPFLAVAVFDCAVNQGVGAACRLLQLALNVSVDGVIGSKTVSAAYKAELNGLWFFMLERSRLYMRTAGVQTWGANWGTRLIELAKTIFDKVPA